MSEHPTSGDPVDRDPTDRDLTNGDPMDRNLELRFKELRAEDRARTPDFGPMLERARKATTDVTPISSHRGFMGNRRWRRWTAIGGGLVAAAAAALLLVAPDSSSDQEFAELVNSYAANTVWNSPTDGLLDVPGREVLRTVPSIAMPRVLGPMSAMDSL